MSHFFFRDVDSPGDVSGFAEYPTMPSETGFTLCGERVIDDSGDGELFIVNPPVLRPSQNIKCVLVGEERREGWVGEPFKPDNDDSLKNNSEWPLGTVFCAHLR